MPGNAKLFSWAAFGRTGLFVATSAAALACTPASDTADGGGNRQTTEDVGTGGTGGTGDTGVDTDMVGTAPDGGLATDAGPGADLGESPDAAVGPTYPPPHTEGGTSWTFLVYMVADTNLEYDALNDLQEMAGVGSGDNFNIIVQSDRAAGYTSDGVLNLPDWEQALRLKVDQGSFETVGDVGEVNMGDPATLSDFITWGVSTYPADRYALVFWDHGGGWIGFGDDESADHDGLTLNEIHQGIQDGLAGTDLSRFQMVGFDACLMSTWETAVNLEYQAEYLIGSEELEPGHGWDYRGLQVAHDDPTTDPVTLGNSIIDGFIAQATTEGTLPTVTLALNDLTLVHKVTEALTAFSDAILPQLPDLLNTIGKQRNFVEEYGPLVEPSVVTNMVDISDLFTQLAAGSDVFAPHKDAIDAALAEVTLANQAGAAHASSHGLSIYFPPYPEYYSPGYDRVAGIDAWRNFLKAYHNGGAAVPPGEVPTFIDEGHVASGSLSDGELVVTGTLSADSVAGASTALMYYGINDGESTWLFGDTSATVDESGVVGAAWDLTGLYIQSGDNKAFCYLSIEDRGDTLLATIPFVYDNGTGDQLLTVLQFVVNSETGDILQLTYYAQAGDGWSELSPEPGFLLYPLIQTPGDGGLSFVRTSDVGFDLADAGLTFDFDSFGAGTSVVAALQALNFAGQGDLILYQGSL